MTAEKSAARFALAGANGLTAEAEGADRQETPHASNIATPVAAHKPRGCILVWRDGMLSVTNDTTNLTVLQCALLNRSLRGPRS